SFPTRRSSDLFFVTFSCIRSHFSFFIYSIVQFISTQWNIIIICHLAIPQYICNHLHVPLQIPQRSVLPPLRFRLHPRALRYCYSLKTLLKLSTISTINKATSSQG